MIYILIWATDYPQNEFTIIFIIFFIFIIILLLHLILRWFKIYSKKHPKVKEKEPDIKLKKIPSPKFKLMVGGTYLVIEQKESDINKGFKIFKDELRSGGPGLLVTRTQPEKVLKKFKLGKLPVIWLSRSKSKNSITPTNLGTIVEEIKEFTSQSKDSVVMLDGLEFLSVHNKFERVLKFLFSLRDEIAVNNSRLIISVNPKTLSKKMMAQISTEIKVLNKSER